MPERLFRLAENGTTVRTELLAGATTFLTMAYIIVVQSAVLSGRMFGQETGLDFGALIGVCEQAGFMRDNKLPRARQAMISDAAGTVTGAALGTSTVTSFIESAAGVEQGGRTGLTGLTVAALFLVALFFSPVVTMLGSYPPLTAPALVIVGALMARNIGRIDWQDATEAMPAFLVLVGIPLTFSIADGLALGFIAAPLVKLGSRRGREVGWLTYLLTAVLLAYFVFVRGQIR